MDQQVHQAEPLARMGQEAILWQLRGKRDQIPARANYHFKLEENGIRSLRVADALGAEFTLASKAVSGVKPKQILRAIGDEPNPAELHLHLDRHHIQLGYRHLTGTQKVFFNLESAHLLDDAYVEGLVDFSFIQGRRGKGFENQIVAEIVERHELQPPVGEKLTWMAARGYLFAIDDLGKAFHDPRTPAGEANLARIAKFGLPLVALKLDRVFSEALHQPGGLRQAKQIIGRAYHLGLNAPELVLEGSHIDNPEWMCAALKLRQWWLKHQGRRLISVSGVYEKIIEAAD